MKTILLLLLITFLAIGNLSSQITKSVLFLGNSYTNVNNLPLIVQKLSQSAGDVLVVNSNTPGGYTLQGHSTNATSLNFIQQGTWDFVVLQDQSQRPSFPMAQVSVEVFPYAEALCNSIVQANPCAKPLFYMTWGRKFGDQGNCANWPPVCSYNGMDSLLNLRYRMMADSNEALVSPVGAAWHYVRDNYPNIELYASDNSHPSLAGSYLAACTFYAMIYQKSPLLITNDYGLNSGEASKLRTAAKIIAFDSLSKWNIGKFAPQSKFIVTESLGTITTVNASKYSVDYKWNFGDGTVPSTQNNPSHIYANSGTYTISLNASKCQKFNESDTTISVIISSVKVNSETKVEVFPNPVISNFTIKLEKKSKLKNIALYSIDGRLIERRNDVVASELQFDLSDANSGIYIVSFELDGKPHKIKVAKK